MSGTKKVNGSPRQSKVKGSSNDVASPKSQPIEIFLRLRPLSKQEEQSKESNVTKVLSDTQIAVCPPKSSLAHKSGDYQEHRFTFSKVLDSTVSQEEFYQETVKKEVIELFTNNKNSLITAYGCSGTGKSHTIHGSKKDPGLMENIFSDLFTQIDSYKDRMEQDPGSETKKDHMVFLSYIEIYNEKIYDLLAVPPNDNTQQRRNDNGRTPLKLKFDKQMKPCVDGLREVPIRDVEHAKEVLLAGNSARQSGSTAVNQISSRSHALLTIKLVSMPSGLTKKKLIKNPEKYLCLRKLTVVDMAGNERSKRTLASGARMKETSNINSSLMIFRNCIEALKANQQTNRSSLSQVVPFRESKLTTLLKEFLVGNGKTTMIVCASPCATDYDETINSLKFSSIAKEVHTVQIPVSTPKRTAVTGTVKNSQEAQKLKKQVKELQQYCKTLETRLRKELSEEFANNIVSLQEKYLAECEQERKDILQQTIESHNAEIEIISSLNRMYQSQVEEIFHSPEKFISSGDKPDQENLEQSKILLEQKEALEKERDELQKNCKTQQTRLNSLQIRMNNHQMENHELREQIESLENRIEHIQNSQTQFHEGETADIEYNEVLQQLKHAKTMQMDLEGKYESLDEENRVLKDQLKDLQTLLTHKREELKDLRTVMDHQQTITTPLRNPATPNRQTPSRGTPSRRIDRMLQMITPKSKPASGKVPIQVLHNDSSGNVQTWQGDVNPSVTGDGYSAHFSIVQKTKHMRASTFMNDSTKDDIKRDTTEEVLPSDDLQMMNGAFRPVKILASKKNIANRDSSNAENILNGKRGSSFAEVPLDLDPPPKKKSRKMPRVLKPQISSGKRPRTKPARK